MTVEELAHWRYRLGAIERELETATSERSWLEGYISKLKKQRRLSASEQHSDTLTTQIQQLASEAEEFSQAIRYNTWLREEARYRIELVQAQLWQARQ